MGGGVGARAGANFLVVAVNSPTPEKLANESGQFAWSAVQVGVHEAVCAASATMTPKDLAAKMQ
jgi:hypothetical protein